MKRKQAWDRLLNVKDKSAPPFSTRIWTTKVHKLLVNILSFPLCSSLGHVQASFIFFFLRKKTILILELPVLFIYCFFFLLMKYLFLFIHTFLIKICCVTSIFSIKNIIVNFYQYYFLFHFSFQSNKRIFIFLLFYPPNQTEKYYYSIFTKPNRCK